MIKNELQYKLTRTSMEGFQARLELAQGKPRSPVRH